MTLRYLSGGSYLDIYVVHRSPGSSFFANCDEIIRVIDKALHIRFDPSDLMWNKAQSRAFGRGISPLSCCVGAIYGLAKRISEPRGSEIHNTSSSYNRKGFF
jgi:hypothetical protein